MSLVLGLDLTGSTAKGVSLSEPEDMAMGTVNLVFQSVGTAAVLAARLCQMETIAISGSLTRMLLGRQVLKSFSQLYSVNLIIPAKAEYATAICAALQGNKSANY